MKRLSLAVFALAAAFAVVASVGCATKKYVKETIAPVQKKVEDIDKKDASQDASIADLGKGVSRADERAQGADNRAGEAAREAARANEQAALANKQAGAAQSTADKGVAQAGQAQRSVGALGTKVENLDNYKLASSETVLFAIGKSDLSKDAQAQLDAFAGKVAPMKHYVIEVQGYTDATGAPAANLELSRRRAAAVVRYLTMDKKIPLFRVSTVGYGKENPAADNKTRDGRKQNRRVEVRLFTPDLGS
ncbi:MAG: OmpA family protein [Bryobacteraceae bacterium]|jgi:outer membrane protein OmpA-like peptidoglycan-associated protein